jgi:activating molecule in BECN1-regulated autophagy protein 1
MNPAQSSLCLGVNLPHLLFSREINDGNGVSYCARNVYNGNKRKLEEWQEMDSLHHCSASYADFNPAPRSTIALSHSCDGTLLASTHGDHTVKITECGTGRLVWVLSGHRRTPLGCPFPPQTAHLLASGSLDHEVRLWDATTGSCLARHTFGKPIASLAFHPSSPLLAIACGHKLYVWNWTATDTPPQIVLKTRRSMRAVHFHPHGVPLLLTAEVQDPSPSRDLPVSMTEDGPFLH